MKGEMLNLCILIGLNYELGVQQLPLPKIEALLDVPRNRKLMSKAEVVIILDTAM